MSAGVLRARSMRRFSGDRPKLSTAFRCIPFLPDPALLEGNAAAPLKKLPRLYRARPIPKRARLRAYRDIAFELKMVQSRNEERNGQRSEKIHRIKGHSARPTLEPACYPCSFGAGLETGPGRSNLPQMEESMGIL